MNTLHKLRKRFIASFMFYVCMRSRFRSQLMRDAAVKLAACCAHQPCCAK